MEDIKGIYAALVAIAGVMSILGGAIGSFATIKSFLKKIVISAVNDSIEDKIKEAKEETEELTDEELEKLDKSISKVFDLVSKLAAQIDIVNDKVSNTDAIMKDNIVSSAKHTINEAYKTCMKQGWIDAYTLASLEEMFVIYKSLGGNHFIESHMETLRELPNEKPKAQPRKKTPKN